MNPKLVKFAVELQTGEKVEKKEGFKHILANKNIVETKIIILHNTKIY